MTSARTFPAAALAAGLLAATSPGAAAGERAPHTLSNDQIEVVLDDAQYPFDELAFVAAAQFWNFNLGLHDGVSGYSYNGVLAGASPLVRVGDVVLEGTDPSRTVTMTFGDDDPPSRFEIELAVSMSGDGSRGVRADATVTNLLAEPLEVRLYLFGDLSLAGTDASDVTAVDPESGIAYAREGSATWFGVRGVGFPGHWVGQAYDPDGLNALRTVVTAGGDYPDTVDGTPGDQIMAWNWVLGDIADVARLSFALAAGDSLEDLVATLEGLAADPSDLFADGFESGNLSAWSSPPR